MTTIIERERLHELIRRGVQLVGVVRREDAEQLAVTAESAELSC